MCAALEAATAAEAAIMPAGHEVCRLDNVGASTPKLSRPPMRLVSTTLGVASIAAGNSCGCL